MTQTTTTDVHVATAELTPSASAPTEQHGAFDRWLRALFPLRDHPLYGSVASFEQCGFLTPARLSEYSETLTCPVDVTNLEVCPTCFFQTSGTTSRAKRIPYTEADLARQREHEATAFRKLGMTASDGVLSLGSPPPSISAWAIEHGSRALGAEVLNGSQLDFDELIGTPAAARATLVIGTPLVVREIGLDLVEQYGSVQAVFPNLRRAVLFGDVLPDGLRAEAQRIWGFERIRGLYGTVEADVVATESDVLGELQPMSEQLLLEVIPEDELHRERQQPGYVPRAQSLLEVQDRTVGELVISELRRELLPILRYRIGDVVQVRRGSGPHNAQRPTVRILGRVKSQIAIGAQRLYEMQIHAALTRAIGLGLQDWRLLEQPQGGTFALQYKCRHADATPVQRAEIVAQLHRERPEVSLDALDAAIGSVSAVSAFDRDAVRGDLKSRRIVLR